jgi:hypothetical protein
VRLPSMQQVLFGAGRAFSRFPFVITVSLLGTAAALILIDYEGPPGPTVLFKILLAAALGVAFLTALALFSEGRRWGRPLALGVQIGGLFLLAAYAFSVPADLLGAPHLTIFRFAMLILAMLFLVMVAPFIGKGQLNGYWHFNKELLFRLLMAELFSVVLYTGLTIALAALDNLFGIDVPGKRYGELWVLICGIFTTWFFLAGVPEDFEGLDSATDYPRGLKVFSQYILSPLVLVYFVILYAYLAKILFTWNWPQGWVGKMSLGFAATGLFSLLLLYPIRDRVENSWIRAAWRWFFVILIPLVVVFFLAVWRRITDYGVTENRYLGVMSGVWLVVMIIYFIASKKKNIKVIPGSLAALALLVSIGPWGAFSVSERSQTARLKELLIKDSILVEGTVQKAPIELPSEDRRRISSILTYLHDVHGYDGIQPWFRESLKSDTLGSQTRYKDPVVVTPMMGFIYDRAVQINSGNRLSFNADRGLALTVEGYQHFLSAQFITATTLNRNLPNDDISYRFDQELDTMTFVVTKAGLHIDSLQISAHEIVRALVRDYNNVSASDIPPDKMTASAEKGGMKVKICLQHIEAKRDKEEFTPTLYELVIIYSIPAKAE